MPPIPRRTVLGGALASGGVLAAPAIAQSASLKVGLMLPFSRSDAALGEAIASGIDMHVKELGGKMGGRTVELVRIDDESDLTKAPSNVNRLLGRDQVDALIGTVSPSVVMVLVQAAHDQQVPLIIPGAGNVAATREACAPSVFRSSYSNWQLGFGMGKALVAKGVKKAAWITWNFPAGRETADGFSDGLRSGGAELTKVLLLSYPETNFQSPLEQLADLGVEAAGAHFTGAGAVQFVKAYAAAGLREKLPLCGTGFLTEGLLQAQGAAAEGIQTALHYGDDLNNPKNVAFRAAFKSFSQRDANVYAVQGYDAAQMLAVGMAATNGVPSSVKEFAAAIVAAKIDSPRGEFTLSASHNPVQTIWLREAKNGENRVIGATAEALADPGTGCTMG